LISYSFFISKLVEIDAWLEKLYNNNESKIKVVHHAPFLK